MGSACNDKALIRKTEENASAGFLKFLLQEYNLHLLCLAPDVLLVFSLYQKQKADETTLLDMKRLTVSLCSCITKILETHF